VYGRGGCREKTDQILKSVVALPKYKLGIEMVTATHIVFDFTSQIDTARFFAVKNKELFKTVHR